MLYIPPNDQILARDLDEVYFLRNPKKESVFQEKVSRSCKDTRLCSIVQDVEQELALG
jgi:hypothetical protein